jgi:hypothetical protein
MNFEIDIPKMKARRSELQSEIDKIDTMLGLLEIYSTAKTPDTGKLIYAPNRYGNRAKAMRGEE